MITDLVVVKPCESVTVSENRYLVVPLKSCPLDGIANVPLFTPVIGVPGWTCSLCKKSMSHVNALAGSVAPVLSVASPLNEMTSPALKNTPSIGEVMLTVGGVPTTIVTGSEGVLLTPSDTVNRAVY